MKKDFSLNKHVSRSFTKSAWLIALGLPLLALDFFSKAYIYKLLSFKDGSPTFLSLPMFQNFFGVSFEISLALNKGAAWGVLADFQVFLLILRIAVICGILVYLFFFNRNLQTFIPLILITSGAIGNVLDYFVYGCVIDFLHFSFGSYHFAIFNFADTLITIGVAWLLCMGFFTKRYYKEKLKNKC